MSSDTRVRDSTGIDYAAGLAFIAGILTVPFALQSRVWIIPAAIVIVATAPRRSTRAVALWAVAGAVVGLIAVAIVIALFLSAGHAPND